MWSVVGHQKALRYLQRSLTEGRVSHAYLLSGPRQVGKMVLAMDLAKAVNCTGGDRPCQACDQCTRVGRGLHADVQVVGVADGETDTGRTRVAIGIDQVRDVQREASLMPYEGRQRVFIFDGAEHLSEEASNALLKTLEEPADRVLLLLLTVDSTMLPATVLSRCQVVELRPVPRPLIAKELEARFGADSTAADEIARLSGGRPGWAMDAMTRPQIVEQLAEKLDTIEGVVSGGLEERFDYAARLASSVARDRDSGRQELGAWLEWLRDILLVVEGATDSVTHLSRIDTMRSVARELTSAQVAAAIGAVQSAREDLEANVNPRLALESMVLALPRP